jgi:hypothetical protein
MGWSLPLPLHPRSHSDHHSQTPAHSQASSSVKVAQAAVEETGDALVDLEQKEAVRQR